MPSHHYQSFSFFARLHTPNIIVSVLACVPTITGRYIVIEDFPDEPNQFAVRFLLRIQFHITISWLKENE